MYRHQPIHSSKQPKRIILIVASLMATICIVLILIIYKPFSRQEKSLGSTKYAGSQTQDVATKGEQSSPSESVSQPERLSQDKTTTNPVLVPPTGTFVSNHTPNLSGSPAPNKMHSDCATTPGATCQISFTRNDGRVKTLPAQNTDNAGAAYWSWTLQDVGLDTGSWTVEAKATLNNKTETAKDSTTLEVKP